MNYLAAQQIFSTDTFELHQFSFGQVRIFSQVLAEITVNEGAEINTEMVEELHTLLLSLFTNSFSLLINKTNTYSTKFDALTQFGQLEEINKIAVFAPSTMAKFSADFSASIPTSRALNIQVFSDQYDALAWLNSDEY
ncbi:MAG: STAS/SEC14 domain-containing protein [Gammaproteobacteria bacterium]|nr:STAS/SEC14 domain-containing protein [Gammaproteobacteria bacterium]